MNKDFHVNFNHEGINYNLNLVKGEKSVHSVSINGINYVVLGKEETLDKACEILNSISLDSITDSDDLKGRLSLIKEFSVEKTDDIGTSKLGTKQEFRLWRKAEEENLPRIKNFLARIASQNQERFENLSTDEIWDIRNNQNCHPLGFVKTEPYEITEVDRINLKNYLDDVGFSGVVSLSDFKGTYTITPTKQESLEDAAFSMNSISKMFTGALALMTMSPEELEDKIHLSPEILTFLKKEKEEIFNHLQKPSLQQAMNHNGGFGDYLLDYEKKVAEAVAKNENPPAINSPEDFLKYAETTLHPLDSGIYSNLGILLVGLAVQHKMNIPYEKLLEEMILTPAGMNISRTKPENGKFNANDPAHGMITGGPSGGHWATTKDLIKLSKWLQDQCKDETSDFLAKMKTYGREFYVPEDEEIRHNGCSSAGSSFLSSFMKSGVSIAVLSDQTNFMANRIYYTIREQLIE